MSNKVYIVEWRRFYSEYDFCYISLSKESAEEVKRKLEEEYKDDIYGTTFTVNEYNFGQLYDIWE